MARFLLAFDTNLKPMVGQQMTVRGDGELPEALEIMVAVAARGDCDIAVDQNGRGYLMDEPNAQAAQDSRLRDSNGQAHTLQRLIVSGMPATFTCYPPHPDKAEARRVATDRSSL